MVVSIDGFTAARSQAIEDAAIIGGSVDGSGDLILEAHDGSTINAGAVVGPTGPAGSGLIVCSSSTRPGSPSEGDMIWETDTNRIYVWPGGSWRWIWSQNGEDVVRKGVDVGADDDATGAATWPSGLEIAVDIPPWAKYMDVWGVWGQAKQVTSAGNTSVQILLGSRIMGRKRVRWDETLVTSAAEQDLVIIGAQPVDDLADSSQLFRGYGERVSGSGALRVDDESSCHIWGQFRDVDIDA